MIDDKNRSKYKNQPVKTDGTAVMHKSYGMADLAIGKNKRGNKL